MSDRSATKILVVDDASFMRAVLKDILAANGFTNLYEASDGALAVDGFKKYRPDMVTMDVNMPNMDGVHALRAILQIDPKAKVIMVTSVEQKHIVQEAMKLGARDYVVKPFERNMVSTVVNRVLRGR